MESAIYAQNDELGSGFQGRIKLPFWEWHWHHPTKRERKGHMQYSEGNVTKVHQKCDTHDNYDRTYYNALSFLHR